MNCPKCNSGYVSQKKVTEELEYTKTEYVCSACYHVFYQETKRELPKGELIMEIRSSQGGYYDADAVVRFYLTPEKQIAIIQKSKHVDTHKIQVFNLYHKPKFKIYQYMGKYSINYDSYRTPNDSKGTLFKIIGISLYGELAEKAKSNEAMNIILKNNSYTSTNEQLMRDAIVWLSVQPFGYPIAGADSSGTSASNSDASSGGCYVATAIYGSYDCPEVWTLRRFRDYTLAKSVFGRAFIRTYYAISPTLVKWFGKTKFFNMIFKAPLDKMVKKLNEKGYLDTPYDDKSYR